MKDPALGPTRAERAFGKNGVPTKKSASKKAKNINKNTQIRNENVGQFSGVRPTYQRYTVSEQASDILNRSIRNRGER